MLVKMEASGSGGGSGADPYYIVAQTYLGLGTYAVIYLPSVTLKKYRYIEQISTATLVTETGTGNTFTPCPTGASWGWDTSNKWNLTIDTPFDMTSIGVTIPDNVSITITDNPAVSSGWSYTIIKLYN